MYLKKRKVKGSYYWSIVESYREAGKVKQKVLVNLGNTEKAYSFLSTNSDYSHYLDMVIPYYTPRSPLIWFGGKSKLAKYITGLFPKHKTYVEPFGGGASILIQKRPSIQEVFNDLNKDVVNFLMVVRESTERFYQAVESLPYSRSLYEEWRHSLPPDNSFDRAVWWFYLNRAGVCGAYKGKTGGWRHGRSHNTAGSYRSAVKLIRPLAGRLKSVNLECKDFRDVISRYDSPKTFFYCDPPYIDREQRYDGGFNQSDHEDLAKILSNISGKALVSYNDHHVVRDLYPGWYFSEIENQAFSKVVRNGESKPPAQELILGNYDFKRINIAG